MLAMTYRGPNRVRVDEKPRPRIEHPNDVVLRVTRSTICGSDLHIYHGFVPDTRVGSTFGHEFTGVVEEAGPSVETLKKGDRVVVPFTISCGTCFFCSRGLFSACQNSNPSAPITAGIYGYSHTCGGYDGGQAEYVRVPYADVGPMKIPENMDYEDALFLSDILPTGYQAAEMGQIKKGDTVVVFGCGPVGVCAMKSAWLQGAGRVIGVDWVPYRLDFARIWAQAETVDLAEVDMVPHLKKMCDGRGPDVAIDAVGLEAEGSRGHNFLGRRLMLEAGSPQAINWAIESVRRCGTVVLIGVYGPPMNMIPIGTAMNKGLTLRMGQCNAPRYMGRLLEHIQAGHIDPKGLITHRMPLEEIAEGYRMFEKKEDGCMKIVLIPPSEEGHA